MFWVIHKRDNNQSYTFLGEYNTIVGAMAQRKVNGDLIYRSDGRIVKDLPWTRACVAGNSNWDDYARKCIDEDKPLGRRL